VCVVCNLDTLEMIPSFFCFLIRSVARHPFQAVIVVVAETGELP